jgi:putative transposase
MVKVEDRRKLKWCLVHYESSEVGSKWAAKRLQITPRRFQQLYKEFKETGKAPDIGLNVGRPKKEISEDCKQIIKQQYEKTHCGAVYLEKTINTRQGIHIPHNVIHQVLLELGYADQEESKQKRRKPWIRYERRHSLSLVHSDYHYCENDQYLCTILDDASRKVLAAGDFDNKTTGNALALLKKACKEYKPYHPIFAIVTDHGSEFYANKRDAKGCAEHEFERFLDRQGIKHILCGVNHPQTNGKIEKWHDLYIRHRSRFDSLDKLVEWYNNEKPHGALNLNKAETPSEAFIRKMRPEAWLSLAAKTFG